MFRVFSEPVNANVSYKVGNWHASFPLRKETAAATTSGWPDYRLLEIDANLLVLPPARLGRFQEKVGESLDISLT